MRKSLFASVLFAVSVVAAPASVYAATTVTVSGTGTGSVNKVTVSAPKKNNKLKVTNNNTIGSNLVTVQSSASGNAKVKKNTDGGDATTGAAANANGVVANVTVSNPDPATPECGCSNGDVTVTVQDSGTDSKNIVKVTDSGAGGTTITNNNIITISNSTSQSAASGNASVVNNTTGGNATSGNATNTNSTNLTLTVTN